MNVYIYIYVCICMYLCMYLCMYVCIHVCRYTILISAAISYINSINSPLLTIITSCYRIRSLFSLQVPKGCVLGIRVGETLKQKRFDSTRPSCSFPKPDHKMRPGSTGGQTMWDLRTERIHVWCTCTCACWSVFMSMTPHARQLASLDPFRFSLFWSATVLGRNTTQHSGAPT